MLGLLAPRSIGVRADEGSRPGYPVNATAVIARARRAREQFERRKAAADSVAAAVLAVAPEQWKESGLSELQKAIASDHGGEASDLAGADDEEVAAFVHDLAVKAFKDGHIAHAVVLFATLLHMARQEAEALSGLALCAVRLDRFDQALTLATEGLNLPEKHPRAYCIAGFCELERGNRKAAQSLLALGARIARRRPEFAEDLRAAQRVLLILHFA